MIRILIAMANGSEEMEAIIPADMLRRAGFEVLIAGEAPALICSRGIEIIPDTTLNLVDPDTLFDAVVLPGGSVGARKLGENIYLKSILKHHASSGKLIAAICAAPVILVNWHILPENSEVTSHPSVEELFTAYTYLRQPVVESGNFITSRGAGTAIDFALAIIKRLAGEEKAVEVAKAVVYEHYNPKK